MSAYLHIFALLAVGTLELCVTGDAYADERTPSGLHLISLPSADDELTLAPPRADVERYQGAPARHKTLFQWSFGDEPDVESDDDEVEPIVTDRPDFTEASSSVGRGVLQIEMGYTFTQDTSAGTRTQGHSYGEPLFRYGILDDWLEFRLAIFPVSEHVTIGAPRSSTSGAEDIYLGFKVALTEQRGWLPEMALVPQMTIPTGHSQFSNDETLAGLNWLYGWDINDNLSTAGSTQFNRAVDDTGQAYIEFAQSWTVGFGLTEKLGAYTEWFAFFPNGADTARVEHYGNAGFTYLITDDVQWDIRAGLGLNEAADDFFTGTGISIRFR
ncbi:MAG: transporter [Planctomycetota bacterium]|nr:transporter [Planctomycetota bacterium]MDA1213893.1 transporter [Planctomycetota bacterium]